MKYHPNDGKFIFLKVGGKRVNIRWLLCVVIVCFGIVVNFPPQLKAHMKMCTQYTYTHETRLHSTCLFYTMTEAPPKPSIT